MTDSLGIEGPNATSACLPPASRQRFEKNLTHLVSRTSTILLPPNNFRVRFRIPRTFPSSQSHNLASVVLLPSAHFSMVSSTPYIVEITGWTRHPAAPPLGDRVSKADNATPCDGGAM